MKVDYVEETSVRKALAFEIESEVLEREVEQHARDYAKRVRLPGFRPGKVPPDVIRRRFRGAVLEDALEALVNRVVPPELEGRGLRPLAAPKLHDLKHTEGEPLSFRVVFEVLPLVELPEYRGLSARARSVALTEEQLERELQRLRDEAARFDPLEGRPAQAGDFVVADLSWTSGDGPPGRDENALLEVGGADTAEAVTQALVGAQPGETRSALVERPAEGERPARSVRYSIAVKALKQRVLPALDDEFAKDVGDFDSLEALRADLRRRLEAAEERRIDQEVKQALVDELLARASFEVPEALVERHMDARTEQAARALALQGVDPSKSGVDWRGFREAQREKAQRAARADILLAELARREGLEVSDAELDAELARYAQAARKSKEAMRRQMEKEGDLAALRARLREDKTLDLLKANARLIFE